MNYINLARIRRKPGNSFGQRFHGLKRYVTTAKLYVYFKI